MGDRQHRRRRKTVKSRHKSTRTQCVDILKDKQNCEGLLEIWRLILQKNWKISQSDAKVLTKKLVASIRRFCSRTRAGIIMFVISPPFHYNTWDSEFRVPSPKFPEEGLKSVSSFVEETLSRIGIS